MTSQSVYQVPRLPRQCHLLCLAPIVQIIWSGLRSSMTPQFSAYGRICVAASVRDECLCFSVGASVNVGSDGVAYWSLVMCTWGDCNLWLSEVLFQPGGDVAGLFIVLRGI